MKIVITVTWRRALAAGVFFAVGAPVLLTAAFFIERRLNPPEVYPFDEEDLPVPGCGYSEEGRWEPVDDRAKFLGAMEFIPGSENAYESVIWETAGEFELDWRWHYGTDARVYYKLMRTERSLLPLDGAFVHFVRRPRYFIEQVTDDPCAVAVVICGRHEWIDRHVYARGARNLREEGILCDHPIYTAKDPAD